MTPSRRAAPEPWSGALVRHVLAALVGGLLAGGVDGLLAGTQAGLEPLTGLALGGAVGLAALLQVPASLGGGLLLGGGAVLGGRLLGVPRLRRLLPWGMGVVLVGGAIGCVAMFLRLGGRQIDLRAVDLRGPWLLFVGAGTYGLGVLLSRQAGRGALAALALVAGGSSALLYGCAGADRRAALIRVGSEAWLSARMQRAAMELFDRDGDGFPRWLCTGGCDCNDEDPTVSPGARDLPGNGRDEDCSGADDTPALEASFARVFAPRPLPAVPPPRLERAEEGQGTGEHRRLRKRHRSKRRRKRESVLAHARSKGPSRPPLVAASSSGSRRSQRALRDRLLALHARSEPSPPPVQLPPNLLLITIDSLRADHLGVYGYPYRTSPRIDQWAQTAVVFDQARAAGPATRFSIPAMLTGKHFTEVRRSAAEWPRVDDSEVMLAERLRDAGYFTAAFHSVIYLHDRYGFAQGFVYRDLSFFRHAQRVWETPTAEYIKDRVLQFADRGELARAAPFFLWVYLGDPHAPYLKHQGFVPEGVRGSAAYDSEVAYTDHHVGLLLDGLRERGLLQHTIVILHSDHGEGLDRRLDHGSRHHSKNLYDELIRVPLIVAGPGVVPRRVRTPVSLIDLVPTALELAGRPHEARDPVLRGESLVPYLRGQDPPHRPVFAEKHRAQDPIQKCMVLWPYKVIGVWPFNEYSIYHLEADPREQHNIVAQLPSEERQRLLGTFRYWATHILTPTPDNPRH
ncbi:MAG: sulfatase-like hydrolase/transferase [Myxococcales bacterium]|nr:sulfatase-like hydrolase/transferase [Myxococcota bacterium]MDW8282957.1 sulfatase-like hydrolase/transferase [Myxococcales bacterium]